jgi:hypothetical protein
MPKYIIQCIANLEIDAKDDEHATNIAESNKYKGKRKVVTVVSTTDSYVSTVIRVEPNGELTVISSF